MFKGRLKFPYLFLRCLSHKSFKCPIQVFGNSEGMSRWGMVRNKLFRFGLPWGYYYLMLYYYLRGKWFVHSPLVYGAPNMCQAQGQLQSLIDKTLSACRISLSRGWDKNANRYLQYKHSGLQMGTLVGVERNSGHLSTLSDCRRHTEAPGLCGLQPFLILTLPRFSLQTSTCPLAS